MSSAGGTMVVSRLSDGLVSIDGQPWRRVVARKNGLCSVSRRAFLVGELVYRPFHNRQGRDQRIIASVIEGAA